MEKNNNHEKIVLGGGCFWCTEAILNTLEAFSRLLANSIEMETYNG